MQEQEIYIVVNGHSIKKSTADLIQERILLRVQSLSDYPAYTVEKLCGRVFWEGLPKGQQILAGIYVSHQVEMGNLPLRHVPRKQPFPKYYRLK
ncbi:MAG TPA: hypothetical protein VK949_00755 [Methylotenera sp.]|nr:hypothetical protein [Methylotenera sp.]